MAYTVFILVTVVLVGVAHHIVDCLPFYFAHQQTAAADAQLPATVGTDRIFFCISPLCVVPKNRPLYCACFVINCFCCSGLKRSSCSIEPNSYLFRAGPDTTPATVSNATTTASTQRTTVKSQHKPPVPTVPTISAEIPYKPLPTTTTTTIATTNKTPVPITVATTIASTRRTTVKSQHKPPVPTIPTTTAEIPYKPLPTTAPTTTTTIATTNKTPVPSTTEAGFGMFDDAVCDCETVDPLATPTPDCTILCDEFTTSQPSLDYLNTPNSI